MMSDEIDIKELHVSVPISFIEAVCHIGVDFGHGEYELEEKWIELARKIHGVATTGVDDE